jgi:dTDP-4-amino-4,6-dideoxygalactose transaminase
MTAFLPFEWPGSFFIGEEEIANVTKTLTTKSPYRNYGHDVQHFCDKVEHFYKERLSRKYAQLVSSGTTALSTALMAADVGPGDEVCVPGYLWVACLSAIVRLGGIPRLVDIHTTFAMDPTDLERKINERTKVVLLVHMSGCSGDVARVVDICKARRVLLIEDVAQANGASFHGKPLGSFGDMAIFSFQYNKNITSGEGGLVVTDSVDLYNRASAFHDTGYVRNAQGRVLPESSPVQGWGQCVHMSDLTAGLLLAQCHRLDHICSLMRDRNHQLYAGLAEIPGCKVRTVLDPSGDAGNFVIATFPSAAFCRAIVESTRSKGVRPEPGGLSNINMHDGWGLHLYYHNVSLVNKHGVNSAGRPWSDPLNAFAKDISYGHGTLPVCDDLFARSVLIAVPPVLTQDQVQKIISIYRTAAAELFKEGVK